LWSDTAKGLLRDLGVAIDRFDTAFDREFYFRLGLSRGVFFNREAFGSDVLVPNDALLVSKGQPRPPLESFIYGIPLSTIGRQQLVSLYHPGRDPLAGKSVMQKTKILKSTSYRDYLISIWGCSEEVANCFQGRTLDFFGLGCDAVPAYDLRNHGYPGFEVLGLPPRRDPETSEPYIYHFPDGNASLARLLVRKLVTGVASGNTMDDIVLADFDYAQLDRGDGNVHIRLNSTVIDVRQTHAEVSIGYVRAGAPHRVAAKHAVLACFHMMIPYIMPDLPQAQRQALAQNVKTPLVYANVVVRDWRSWIALKISAVSAPMAFFSKAALDFPVSMGGYEYPRDPQQPMVLHLVHVPGAPNSGFDARTQFHIGQAKLLAMTFADFEVRIRDQLDRMLGPGGFASERDITAITVNRWPHGYGYVENSLFDGEDYEDRVLKRARQPFGRVAIANSDAGGDAYAHLAIDQAARAVRELLR
jgi:spermidine dehydrogenase